MRLITKFDDGLNVWKWEEQNLYILDNSVGKMFAITPEQAPKVAQTLLDDLGMGWKAYPENKPEDMGIHEGDPIYIQTKPDEHNSPGYYVATYYPNAFPTPADALDKYRFLVGDGEHRNWFRECEVDAIRRIPDPYRQEE